MKDGQQHLSDLGEPAVIRDILSKLSVGKDVVIPPGDDCASVTPPPGTELILTSDPVIEGVHFDPSTPYRQIGHKAVGRALSDLAAMGASPHWILLNIAAPPSTPKDRVDESVCGAEQLARMFGASIVGGDLARADSFSINAFACGTVPEGKAVRRSGASNGDIIFATGYFGDSRSGRHLSFTPRVNEGIWLREQGIVSAMIDTSDGPATDLRHLIEASNVGAVISLQDIPCAPALRRLPFSDMISRALSDGEDFELLFTVPPTNAAKLSDSWAAAFETPLTRIGVIDGPTGEICAIERDGTRRTLAATGFDHFA